MKHFIYFESQEGGMEQNEYSFEDLEKDFNFGLYGWMDENYGCDTSDKELVEWAKTCDIGEFFNHRMGTCVRVKQLE